MISYGFLAIPLGFPVTEVNILPFSSGGCGRNTKSEIRVSNLVRPSLKQSKNKKSRGDSLMGEPLSGMYEPLGSIPSAGGVNFLFEFVFGRLCLFVFEASSY